MSNTKTFNNITVGFVTEEKYDEIISFLAASAAKPVKKQGIQLTSFKKFSSDQKLFCVTAYLLRLLPSHYNYRIVDGSKTDLLELDNTEF